MNLSTPLEKIFCITPEQKKTLKKMEIFLVKDLLYNFPTRYSNFNNSNSIKILKKGEQATIHGKIISINTRKTFKTKISITEGTLENISKEKIKIIWFSQPYIFKFLPVGSLASISGIISEKAGKKIISNPEFEKLLELPFQKNSLLGNQKTSIFPIYKESGIRRGKISSKWIYHKIKKILADEEFLKNIEESIPKKILKKYNLPSLKNSFFYLHLPEKKTDTQVAKKRMAFEEIFFIQLMKGIEQEKYKKYEAFCIEPKKEDIEKFISFFDFNFTKGQNEVVSSILKDFKKNTPMSRLLEGDVGSGKTVVAAAATFFAINTKPKNQSFGNLQVAYMAPTEILAKQIFLEFIKIFYSSKKKIALLTSKDIQIFPSKISTTEPAKISKKKLQEWILNGEIPIIIGTHSLISKNIFFENLGLVIIDEQHRFGKKQRSALRAKPQSKKEAVEKGELKISKKIIKKGLTKNEEILPHLLSMTATPIPRTLALSLYGDLDLSLMTDMPLGRKKIITEIFFDNEKNRKKVYIEAEKELKKGKQIYIICPRIDAPDEERKKTLNLKSAVETQKKIKENLLFKKYEVGLLHSKLSKEEKKQAMDNFIENKTKILVSTSMVEVGLSVKNATLIIIEGGERFGLSQLHQFRGRVMRSSYQPYCYIFSNSKTDKTLERMRVLKTAKNGFELAEKDLEIRGAGEILGNKQSGISDIAMEALKNLKMVEVARNEAQNFSKNEKWKKNEILVKKIKEISKKIYME